MKRIGFMPAIVLAAALVLPAQRVLAQDAEPVIIFGQYLRCNMTQESRADEIVRDVYGPVIDKHVEAGHLRGWAWFQHVQGGAWRRLLSLVGTDMDAMIDARASIISELGSEHGEAMAELGSICGSHDDYIWSSVVTAPPNPDAVPGTATLSAYHACDASKERRADHIFEQLLAPIYQKHVDMGHLSGWAFYRHVSGGIFRRLETFGGPDHKTLVKMLAAIYQEASETDPLAMNEYRSICSWHTDYWWNNATAAWRN